MINFFARLKDSKKAYGSVLGLINELSRENMLTISPKGIGWCADGYIWSSTGMRREQPGLLKCYFRVMKNMQSFYLACPKSGVPVVTKDYVPAEVFKSTFPGMIRLLNMLWLLLRSIIP